METTKEIRADAKLKSLPQEVRDTLWRFRYPEEDGEKLTYVAVLAWLKSELGLESSLAALSDFYSWERMERRMAAARERAEQARRELASDPNATPEAIARVGQMVFTAEMVDDGNLKAFVALEQIRIQQRQLDLDHAKFSLIKAKADRLDAMEAKARDMKAGGGLTPETLEMLEKQLKLL